MSEMSHNQRLRNAIYSTGLECSEEPMRKELQGQAYATWNKVTERKLHASGSPFAQVSRFLIEAYLLPNDSAQDVGESIKAALKAHGFRSVRQTAQAYDALINRRIIAFTASWWEGKRE